MMGEAGSVAESADAPVDSVPPRPLERFAVSDAASAHIPSDPPVAARRHLPSVNVRLSVSRKLYLSFGVVVGLVVAGRRARATALVAGAGNDASDALVSALTAYQTRVAADAARATASFNAARTLSYWVMGILGAVAVLVAVGLATLIARSLSRGIRQMLTAAEGI